MLQTRPRAGWGRVGRLQPVPQRFGRPYAALGEGVLMERGGRVAGTGVRWSAGHATVGLVIVHGAHRGQGLGKRLMQQLLAPVGQRSVLLHAVHAGSGLEDRLVGVTLRHVGGRRHGARRPAQARAWHWRLGLDQPVAGVIGRRTMRPSPSAVRSPGAILCCGTFDVCVGPWWLQRGEVEDVAQKLGLDVVPVTGEGTLHDAVAMAKAGIRSTWGDFQAEGGTEHARWAAADRQDQVPGLRDGLMVPPPARALSSAYT